MTEVEAAPPPYYSNFEDLYTHIATNVKQADDEVWTDEQKRKFHDAVDVEMTKDSSGDSLKQEMDQLQASSNTIKQVFRDVSGGFQTVHDASQHEDFKSNVMGLKKRWDEFNPVFVGIEREAKSTANNASVVANDFATDFGDFLRDPKKSLDDKKTEVDSYKKNLEADKKGAADIKAKLDVLVNDINTLNEDWQAAAAKEKKILDGQAKELNIQLEKLNTDIDELTVKINNQIVAVALSGVGIGICILAGFLCPAFWFGTVIFAGLGAVSGTLLGLNVDKRAKFETQRDGVKDQLKQIKGQQDAIDLLLTGVHSVDNESKNATRALGVFQNVWQGLISDLDTVIHQLELAEKTGDKDLAHRRLETTRNGYRAASIAMKYYSSKA